MVSYLPWHYKDFTLSGKNWRDKMLENNDFMERQNDAIIQSSCDRRTLATIAVWLRENGEPVTTASSVVRLAMERLREIIINHAGAQDIETSDDATDVLKFIGASKVNPSGRNMATYVKKMEIESQLLDGGNLEYVTEPAKTKADLRKTRQVGKLMPEAMRIAKIQAKERLEETQKPVIRMPDNVVETPEQAVIRRDEELEASKSQMLLPTAQQELKEEEHEETSEDD